MPSISGADGEMIQGLSFLKILFCFKFMVRGYRDITASVFMNNRHAHAE